MLRITVHDNVETLTFQLEGRLAGAWVRELEECWQRTLAGRSRPTVRIDLAAVTFVDADGKAFLATANRKGAKLFATDCLMKAVVAEVTRAPTTDCGPAGESP